MFVAAKSTAFYRDVLGAKTSGVQVLDFVIALL
jgi:hypothetical protein